MNIYSISSTPYYDNIKEEYKNILTINMRPKGPLSERIKLLQPQRISSFVGKSSNCIYAIIVDNGTDELMNVVNIPELFNFLSLNNYQIDTSLTTMMHDREFNSNNRLICFIRWNNCT